VGDPRIVSLIASSTEIVCALGFESQLVGRSHECDTPASVRQLPGCTEPKFDIRLASFEIDQRVRGLVQEALSVYRVDADKLRELRPDLVITQTQCEVCAVSQRDVECALADWIESRPRIVSLTAESLQGVWDDIRRVAAALGVPERGAALVAQLEDRIGRISERTSKLSLQPTVACIEWIDPLMASGNWMPELVALAGGRNLFGEAGRHSPQLDWNDLARSDPDVVVVLPCGFDLQRTRQEMHAIESRPEWRSLRARREARVFLADGNQFFNRPGPRLVELLEILAEILHGDALRFGHVGRGYERYEAESVGR
jgi:iron complex transport system substrate-binding protein